MLRAVAVVLVVFFGVACGGRRSPTATRTPAAGGPAAGSPTAPAATGGGGAVSGEVLCALLTFQTILENAPFEGAEEITIAGADEAQLDPEIAEGTAGIAVRAGRFSFTIGLPSGENAETQLTTLASNVLERASVLR